MRFVNSGVEKIDATALLTGKPVYTDDLAALLAQAPVGALAGVRVRVLPGHHDRRGVF